MITDRTADMGIGQAVAFKAKAYVELIKFRLSFLVAFSAVFGYLLAVQGAIDMVVLTMLGIGGLLVSGASVTVNQVLEKDLDKLMSRTLDRPLPTGRVSVREALIFAAVIGTAGLMLLLVFTNMLTVLLSMLSMALYSVCYTPLKRVGPISVLVGAVPGALPPLLGWVAATGMLEFEAFVIFAIQFIWQFPHFWAIAWVADDDYKKAGFKMLPSSGGRDLNTAFQIMIYTLFLIPLGILPTKFGLTGINAAIIATICGCLFLMQTFYLMKSCSNRAALPIMFGSFLYLPIVQIAFVIDKV